MAQVMRNMLFKHLRPFCNTGLTWISIRRFLVVVIIIIEIISIRTSQEYT